MSKKIIISSLLILFILGTCSCQPQEVTVEKSATRVVTQPVTVEQTVVIPVEKTVIVTEQETVQVVVTSTPAPIPRGGYITRTTYADAKTLNPLLATDPGSLAFCELAFEGLVTINPFTGVLEPNLAQSWTVSEDGLTYTFALRPGLVWSDNTPITAYDFYFAYSALLSGKLDTQNNRLVSPIQAIQVLDEQTVSVTFAEPDCGNLERLQIGWVPVHVFLQPEPTSDLVQQIDNFDFAELAGHEFNSRPSVFSGPFVLEEWVRGDHWTQVRNDNYWRGAPHLDGIITRIVSGQEDMIDLLKKNEIDIGMGFDPQYLVQVEQVPDLHILKFLSDEYDFIGFQMGNPNDPQPRLDQDGLVNEKHGQHPILQDKRVRQAIVHALDREQIIRWARVGQGIPLHANILPTISWAYNTDLEPRAYDLDQANQLLEQAGWVMDQNRGVRTKNGRRLELTLYTNAGNAVRESMAQLIKEQLAEVGIQVEVMAVEWNSFLDVLFGQTFDMVLISWSNLGVNPDDAHLWSAKEDVPNQGANFVSYYNPELEEMLAQASSVTQCDQDTRIQLYRQIQAQLYEDQPYCWLDVPRTLVAVNRRIGGVNPGPWNVWYNIHEWYIQK